MDPREVLVDARYIELDAVLDGFQGAVAEMCTVDGLYVVRLTASGTGDRVLCFTSAHGRLARDVFEKLPDGGATGLPAGSYPR